MDDLDPSEWEEFGRRYPEYDDMTLNELDYEYETLLDFTDDPNPYVVDDVRDRQRYIDHLTEKKYTGDPDSERYNKMSLNQLRSEYKTLLDHEDDPNADTSGVKDSVALIRRLIYEKGGRDPSIFDWEVDPYEEARWIDKDIDHEESNKKVIREKGVKQALIDYTVHVFRKNQEFTTSESKAKFREDYVKLTTILAKIHVDTARALITVVTTFTYKQKRAPPPFPQSMLINVS